MRPDHPEVLPPQGPDDDPANGPPAEVQSVFQAHFGPIPAAHELSNLADVDPSFPERVVKMAEKQAKHRQATTERGQWFGFIIALVAFGVCIYAISVGFSGVAGTIGSITVVGLASVFVVGKLDGKFARMASALLQKSERE